MDIWQQHKETLIVIAVLFLAVIGIFIFAKSEGDNKEISASQQGENKETLKDEPITNNKKIMGATIVTNQGEIEIAFFEDKAPETVANFIKLAKSGFYDGTKFHRVIKDFMIQGGDPNSKGNDETLYGRGGPGYQFADEPNDQPLVKGVVAMANSGPDTNGSQFFIITAAATPWLQGKHTAFAKVTKGMEIADKISNVAKNADDVPLEPVVLEKVILK